MALNFFRKGSMKGEKAGLSNKARASLTPGSIARLLVRFFQFVMGIVALSLYAIDLDHAHKAGVGYDSKWMYATMVGTLSAAFALAFMTPLKAWFFFIIDVLIFILYLTAFGIFGKMYIKEDPEGDKGIIRMKRAVWIQLVNTLLWLGTASYGAVVFWKERKGRTTFTGQAPSHV